MTAQACAPMPLDHGSRRHASMARPDLVVPPDRATLGNELFARLGRAFAELADDPDSRRCHCAALALLLGPDGVDHPMPLGDDAPLVVVQRAAAWALRQLDRSSPSHARLAGAALAALA